MSATKPENFPANGLTLRPDTYEKGRQICSPAAPTLKQFNRGQAKKQGNFARQTGPAGTQQSTHI
jgi:hypothetical protein